MANGFKIKGALNSSILYIYISQIHLIMAELKTKATEISVKDFLDAKADPKVRTDCDTLCTIMQRVTGEPAKIWGPSIVGFGKYHYVYDSGREGEMCITGFSPRKPALTLYVCAAADAQAPLLEKLGKFKSSKGCLYIKKLADVNIDILEQIVKTGVEHLRSKYPD